MNTTTNIIFTILNGIAEMIELTYTVGKATAPYIKKGVALVITAAIYSYENRHKVNEFRHRVSRAFSYEYEPSTPVLKAPKYIRAKRISNTIALS